VTESDLDRLFQLPPEEFTAARNDLVRRGGGDAAALRRLRKPPVAAWAVNQLYWKRRATYTALIDAAADLRRTHKAVLGGRQGDLRAATKAHDAALDTAIKTTMKLLREGGHPASDATRQAIVSTLRALPADAPPGRLEHVLQPGGFEMLSGMTVRGRASPAAPKPPAPKASAASKRSHEEPDGRAEKQRIARQREAAAAAAHARREAEQAARRAEFERARAAREVEKADARVEEARADLDRAREALAKAQAAAAAARRGLKNL